MTQNQSGVSALQKVALVNVDLSIWSGYKRTTESELISVGAALPKDSPLTNGGKKIFPSEFLAEFGQIRKEVSRKLSSVGVAALGGSARAVPETEVDDINMYLNEIKLKFKEAHDTFEDKYDQRMTEYLQGISDPKVKDIIDKAKLEKADAVAKFGMKWQIFKIVPTGDEEESSRSLVAGMASSLFDEVAKSAKDIYQKSFIGKPRVTQKALHQVRSLRNKMAGLIFLDDSNIEPIVRTIDEALSLLPKEGWLDGYHLSVLTSLILKLTNPDQMLEHAKLIAAGMSATAALVVTNDNSAISVIQEPLAKAAEVEETQPVVEVKVVEVSANVEIPTPILPMFDLDDEDKVTNTTSLFQSTESTATKQKSTKVAAFF